MTDSPRPEAVIYKPGPVFVVAMYLFALAAMGRTIARLSTGYYPPRIIPWMIGIEVAFLVLYSLALWRPPASRPLLYLYFCFQSILVVALIELGRDMDFVNGFFMPLGYQAAIDLSGRPRQVWIGIMVVLCSVPLMLIENPLRNLALSMPAMAAIIVIAAYIAAAQEEEIAQAQSRAMLDQLRETHRQLRAYASQVEELTAIEERNRLARELHDSVSQTMFSIILNLRASQMLLERDPSKLRPQLERLYGLSQSALAEMRGLIAQLRPKSE
jgi:signal transduction histidine kinase